MNEQYIILINFGLYKEYVFCGFKGRKPIGVSTMCIDGTQKQYTKRCYAEKAKTHIERYYHNSPYGNAEVTIKTINF